jgi:hypothetical protein
VLTVAACLLNVKLALHPENVPIALGKDVVAVVGIQCNTRIVIIR